MAGRCELLVAVSLCAVVVCLDGGGGLRVGECSVYSVQDRLRIGSAQPDDAAAQQRDSLGAGILGMLLSTVAEGSCCYCRRVSGAEDTQMSSSMSRGIVRVSTGADEGN